MGDTGDFFDMSGSVLRISVDTGANTTLASGLHFPTGVAVSAGEVKATNDY